MTKRASTLQDVAALAGVSRSAAGRVLLGTGGDNVRVAEDTRKRILEASQKLNYTPNRLAQQLRGASAKTIGVIVRSNNTPVMSERIFALESEASARGYRLLIGRVTTDDSQLSEYVNDFAGRGVEAIFCLFDLSPERDPLVREAFRSFKKVLFHGRPAWRGGYSIRTDTSAAIEQAIAHVAASGKRRPALALWNRTRDELMEVRCQAFTQAVAPMGLSAEAAAELIWDAQSATVIPSREVLDAGIEIMVRRNHADAILASNDVWAVRIIQKLKEYGLRVPEDVAVVGHDDLDIGTVIEPQLTTISPNHTAYAKAAMDLLLAIAADSALDTKDKSIAVEPLLRLRASA